MSLKCKTTLIIVITLIIGILIGTFLVAPPIARQRIRKIAKMRHREGFIRGLEQLIEPTDAQQDSIRIILVRYGERFEGVFERQRKEIIALMDSLRQQLDPILTDEQKARLERVARRARCLRPPPPHEHP